MFAVDGIGFGLWASFLPSFKVTLGLSDAGLSIALFAMVVGGLVSMPVAGRVIAQRGSRAVLLTSGVLYASSLPLLAVAADQAAGMILFTIAAAGFGASKGVLDVAANSQAIASERAGEPPIISSCHGFWSLGLLGGAALAGVILNLRVPLHQAMLLICGGLLAAVALASGHLRTDDRPLAAHSSTSEVTAGSRRGLIAIAVLAFFALFCEGTMGDWGAIFFAGEVGASASSAAFGYAGYALAMTVARFAGDRLVARFGTVNLLRGSAFLVAIGLGVAIAVRTYPVALAGFALVGLGLANMIPVLYRSAGQNHGGGGVIAFVATVGSLGFLIGPPIIGTLSRGIGLSLALTMVVGFAALIAASARFAAEPGC